MIAWLHKAKMDVWISSGRHVDNIAERLEQIKKQVEDPDIVFAEGSERSSLREQFDFILSIFPVAPPLATVAGIYIFGYIKLRGRLEYIISDGDRGRDTEIVQKLSSCHNIERCEIDREPLTQYIHKRPIIWGVANWGPLLGTAALGFPILPFFLLVGILLLLGLVMVSIDAREEKMVEIIAKKSRNHDRAIVVLGKGHHLGVGTRLTDKSEINVLNPKPENMSPILWIIVNVFRLYHRMVRS